MIGWVRMLEERKSVYRVSLFFCGTYTEIMSGRSGDPFDPQNQISFGNWIEILPSYKADVLLLDSPRAFSPWDRRGEQIQSIGDSPGYQTILQSKKAARSKKRPDDGQGPTLALNLPELYLLS